MHKPALVRPVPMHMPYVTYVDFSNNKETWLQDLIEARNQLRAYNKGRRYEVAEMIPPVDSSLVYAFCFTKQEHQMQFALTYL